MVLPNLDPFGQTEKGERGGGVQKLGIFHGCHKCMVLLRKGFEF